MRNTICLLICACLVFLFFIACKSRQIAKDTPPMPTYRYDSAWKKVDSLERNQLYQSALEKTRTIQAAAAAENNGPQSVRAAIYVNKYAVYLNEEGFPEAIAGMEEAIRASTEPARSVLYSLTAELYASYLQSYAWRLRDRTNVDATPGDDIRTWDIGTFIRKINAYYLRSIQYEGLKTTSVDAYEEILTDDSNTDHLRPVLYDILGHRAIDYFMQHYAFLTDPVFAYTLTDIRMLEPADAFARYEISSEDTASLKRKAVEVFQQLTRFHLNDKNPDALIDLDLKRLRFVYENLEHDDKDVAYLQALESLEKKYPDATAIAEIGYQKAVYYQQRGTKFKGLENDPYRFDFRTAKEICEEIIRKYPKSKGAKQCQNLLNVLLQPSVNLQTEEVNLHGEKMLVHISFANTSKLSLKLVRLAHDMREKLQDREEKVVGFLNSLPEVNRKEVTLPVSDDLREHRTEVALDAPDYGFYALLVSDSAFQHGSMMAYTLFHISDIAYWSYGDPDTREFAVVHRKSGAPLEGVKADFYTWTYNSNSRKNVQTHLGSGMTDAQGMVQGPQADERQTLLVKLTRGNDVLFLDEGINLYRYYYERQQQRTVYMFTDRSIYRPGQTVYYKGYVVNYDQSSYPSVITQGNLTVSFMDANGQEVAKSSHAPNMYGTFSGEFVAPVGRLAGRMWLQAKGNGEGSVQVQVEEYKRPTFEVKYDSASQAYALGEEITVTGHGMTYAGTAIDHASVQYRVVRKAHFPWMPWWMMRWAPPSAPAVIAQGTATTDAEGKFRISFVARRDASIKGHRPEYVFDVITDITDVAGETRSATKSIILSDQSFRVNVQIGETQDLTALSNVSASATNLNGENVSVNATVTIAKLDAPDRVLRERYWETPDLPLLSEAEFGSSFPSYAIPGKENMHQWDVTSTVGTREFSIRGADTVNLGGVITTPGAYRLSFNFTGDNGDTSSLVLYANCYDPGKALPAHMQIIEKLSDTRIQPGQQLTHQILTSSPLHLRYVADRKSGIKREWLHPNGKLEQKIQVLETDRGGFLLHATYVSDNRTKQFRHTVDVPWTNKELNIEYLSYRDKTEPGAQEEWRLKITGEKKDAVVAEMLATMYDASLDAFLPHQWALSLYPTYNGKGWTQIIGFQPTYLRYLRTPQYGKYQDINENYYRNLEWFDFPLYHSRILMRAESVRSQSMPSAPPPKGAEKLEMEEAAYDADQSAGNQAPPADGTLEGQPAQSAPAPVALRSNLKETVFFMPHVQTDAQGNITLKFKMNESLTRWKFLALAHTKDLKFGLSQKEIVTQKDIMVFPHMPRFLRQKDQIQLTAKVNNMTASAVSASAELTIVDAESGADVSGAFGLVAKTNTVQLPANGSAGAHWKIVVPEDWTRPVKYQVIARAGNKGDGEEGILPVLTDRIFVTETMALHIPSKADKTFVFDAFKNANSTTLEHQGYTVEFTSNPAWLAVQSLPYLQEYPHQCAEQIWNRLYANLLARKIVNQFPEIGETYNKWAADPNSVSLMSNLSKNQELKSALLEETPWVRDAMSEEEQMRNIAILLDENRITGEVAKALGTLKEMQLPNGGFSWFPGGRDSWYITQYIVEGAGHLQKLQAVDPTAYSALTQLIRPSIQYIDDRMLEEYKDLADAVAKGHTKWEDDHLSYMAVHYLYARSFFKEQQSSNDVQKARAYYIGQAEKYWNTKPLYVQGLIALSLHRWNQPKVVPTMKQSFEERSLYTEELGRYWKAENGFYWYELPIERHSLMIELFEELGAEQKWIDELRLWLLKNKQTNRWSSTKSTAAAVYALLMQEDNWLHGAQIAVIVGGSPLNMASAEAGSGYVKQTWTKEEVNTAQSTIEVTNPNNHVAWGGAYWQYFEDMDKVAAAEGTPLKMRKSLWKQLSTDAGLKLVDLADVKVGDKLISRIEIEVDRDMEFVHLKDMRASGLEPINVLSGYKWQGGLGYYESTADLATHFFFDFLPKGKYIFEYPVRVAHAGTFSNGIATMQCMYAPEFSSHSAGLKLEVK